MAGSVILKKKGDVMMATYIVGALLLIAFYFAMRHVYRNIRDGKEDCCGGSCSHCSGCHASVPKK